MVRYDSGYQATASLHCQDTVEHDEFPGLHLFKLTIIQEAVEFAVIACPGLDPGSSLMFRKWLTSTSFSVAVMSDRDGFKLPEG